MAGYHNDKYYGAIYKFTTGKHSYEDEIKLSEISDEFFEDNGHAIAWTMSA